MITKKTPKNPKKYICIKCDFLTSNKKDYDRHLSTRKHKKWKNDNNDNKKNPKNSLGENDNLSRPYICFQCNKSYKYMSGLSRHKNKCKGHITFKKLKKNHIIEDDDENNVINNIKNSNITEENMNDPNIKDMILGVVQQNKMMYEQLLELSKEKQYNQTIYKNCGNKQMTINVFLNEECKDAINLTDFMNQIQINIEDLIYTKDNGYAKGLSNIFIKHLQQMTPTERPIHCSDTKKLQFYVKDEDMWNEDDEHEKIDKSIHDISMKQIQSLRLWEQENPNYLENEKLRQEWHALVQNIMCASGGQDGMNNKKIIKKNLGTESAITPNLLKDKE